MRCFGNVFILQTFLDNNRFTFWGTLSIDLKMIVRKICKYYGEVKWRSVFYPNYNKFFFSFYTMLPFCKHYFVQCKLASYIFLSNKITAEFHHRIAEFQEILLGHKQIRYEANKIIIRNGWADMNHYWKNIKNFVSKRIKYLHERGYLPHKITFHS